MTYQVRLSAKARRALSHELPEAVAIACFEFIYGPLAADPRRVGKQLREPLYPFYAAGRGEFRVVYDVRDAEVVVEVVTIRHRRDVYRT